MFTLKVHFLNKMLDSYWTTCFYAPRESLIRGAYSVWSVCLSFFLSVCLSFFLSVTQNVCSANYFYISCRIGFKLGICLHHHVRMCATQFSFPFRPSFCDKLPGVHCCFTNSPSFRLMLILNEAQILSSY